MDTTKGDKPHTSAQAIVHDAIINAKYYPSVLRAMYPSANMHCFIAQTTVHWPARQHRTHALYIWGKPGTYKSQTVYNFLKTLEICYPVIHWWKKPMGAEQWWDTYDQQQIVVIDDPDPPEKNNKALQMQKDMISVGPCPFEIKYGFVQFTAWLVIIINNRSPADYSACFGAARQGAIVRRIDGDRNEDGKATSFPPWGQHDKKQDIALNPKEKYEKSRFFHLFII